jgi:hypothetical protein
LYHETPVSLGVRALGETGVSPYIAPMTPDNFYAYASILIFVPWLLLIVAPRWEWTERIGFAAAIVLLVAGAWFTFGYLRSSNGEGHLWSLEGFKNLFRSNDMLLTGWLNYLSFGLLVGTWQTHDAQQQKIPHIFVVPCLILTLLAGPTGLLAYLVVRAIRTRQWQVK